VILLPVFKFPHWDLLSSPACACTAPKEKAKE